MTHVKSSLDSFERLTLDINSSKSVVVSCTESLLSDYASLLITFILPSNVDQVSSVVDFGSYFSIFLFLTFFTNKTNSSDRW